MIHSYHTDMKVIVQFNGASSDTFDIRSGVKQGCVFAQSSSDCVFVVMLKYAFGESMKMYAFIQDQMADFLTSHT